MPSRGNHPKLLVPSSYCLGVARFGVEVENDESNPKQRPQHGVNKRAEDRAGDRHRVRRRCIGELLNKAERVFRIRDSLQPNE